MKGGEMSVDSSVEPTSPRAGRAKKADASGIEADIEGKAEGSLGSAAVELEQVDSGPEFQMSELVGSNAQGHVDDSTGMVIKEEEEVEEEGDLATVGHGVVDVVDAQEVNKEACAGSMATVKLEQDEDSDDSIIVVRAAIKKRGRGRSTAPVKIEVEDSGDEAETPGVVSTDVGPDDGDNMKVKEEDHQHAAAENIEECGQMQGGSCTGILPPVKIEPADSADEGKGGVQGRITARGAKRLRGKTPVKIEEGTAKLGSPVKVEVKREGVQSGIKQEKVKQEVKEEFPGATKVKLEDGAMKTETCVKTEVKVEDAKTKIKHEHMKHEVKEECPGKTPVMIEEDTAKTGTPVKLELGPQKKRGPGRPPRRSGLWGTPVQVEIEPKKKRGPGRPRRPVLCDLGKTKSGKGGVQGRIITRSTKEGKGEVQVVVLHYTIPE